jgi:predicted nucleic acid-binding protein
MNTALLLDTGGWLKALAGESPWSDVLEEANELVVPGLVLAEVDYHLRRQRPAMHRLLDDIRAGAYRVEWPTLEDLARARAIDAKFKKLDLGLVDASVVALAERQEAHRVLTIDSDFAAVRFGARFQLAFELACPLP